MITGFQLDEQGISQLKRWLVVQLEPICDAEPTVLADYILALLKHDMPTDQLRQLFVSQLHDFLQDATEHFVATLFQHLSGIRSSSPPRPPPLHPQQQQRGTKRRSDGHSQQPAKYARDDVSPRSGPSSEHGRPQQIRRKKQEFCRDYHHRGYCARGDHCTFIHDEMPYPATPTMPTAFSTPMQGAFSAQPLPPQHPNGDPAVSDAYDPAAAALLAAASLQPMHAASPYSHAGGQQHAHRGGRGSRRPGGGERGQFDGRQKSATTLVVENIPPANLTVDQVNGFFRKFGTITNISLDPPQSKALVSFSTPLEARAAHTSPEVVFGNRFVRIFFQRLDTSDEPPFPPPHLAHSHRPLLPSPSSFYTYASAPPPAVPAAPDPAVVERRRLEADLSTKIERQKDLMAQLEGTGAGTPSQDKRAIMAALREVAAEMEDVRNALVAALPSTQPTKDGSDATTGHVQGETSDLETAQAKLAALQKEARPALSAAAMGIDTGTPSRGRGRGGRGRPYPILRGRGRGRGMPFGVQRSFALDNRSTSLSLDNAGDDFDALREHFEARGGRLQDSDTASILVTFSTRAQAEQVMAAGANSLPVSSAGATLKWRHAESTEQGLNTVGAVQVDATGPDGTMGEDDDEERETSWRR